MSLLSFLGYVLYYDCDQCQNSLLPFWGVFAKVCDQCHCCHFWGTCYTMIVISVKIHCCHFGAHAIIVISVKLHYCFLRVMCYDCDQCQNSLLPFWGVRGIIVISVKPQCCHLGGVRGIIVISVKPQCCHLGGYVV